MLRKNGIAPFILGTIVIISIVVCKYFNAPKILLLLIIIACALYQIDTNKKNNIKANSEEILINLSKFVIITGISGYIIVRIVGLFFTGFN